MERASVKQAGRSDEKQIMTDDTHHKAPTLAGVIGWPVAHSLSPVIHNFWAARAGVNGYYIPVAAQPSYADFARVADGLRAAGFAGLNVTLPHKEHALAYADEASPTAVAAGAANMLTFVGGRAVADNSDVAGFAAALKEQGGGNFSGKSALMLGAGGAARGVALALKSVGVADIVIVNRTYEKAEALADEFSLSAEQWDHRDVLVASADIVINTTNLGMTGSPPLGLDLGGAKADAIIADIVYAPLETPLLKAARARGLPAFSGLSMLMHQAAPGFRQWFGASAEVDDALRMAVEAALTKRAGPQ